ncbi:putative protein kinase IRE1 family [Helianthus anomalus]
MDETYDKYIIPNNIVRSHELLHLIQGIVEDLRELHSMGIIHQNLKLQNVLIVEYNNKTYTRISDIRVIKDHTHLETLKWRAREQMFGEETKETDLFSLGYFIYFCLTRKEDLFAENLFGRDYNVVEEKKFVNALQNYSKAFNLCAQLLNSNPKTRPQASMVLHHPLFWDVSKKILFLSVSSDRLEVRCLPQISR